MNVDHDCKDTKNPARRWRIINMRSGADLGIWDGATADDALDAMSRAAGYRNHAHACAQFTVEPGELRVTEDDDDERLLRALEAIRPPKVDK